MAHNKQAAPQLKAHDAERRAYRRHPVRLRAVYGTGQGSDTPCEIRDLCIGGMYLAQDAAHAAPFPRPGTLIVLRCASPLSDSGETFTFKARIARSEGDNCGIAFIDPDLSALHRLLGQIQKQEQAPPQAASHASAALNALIRECRAMAAAIVPELAGDFLETCKTRIFAAADNSKDSAEKNACFMALGVLADCGERFQEDFMRAVQERLDTGPATCQSLGHQDQGTQAQGLSLVEDEVFEDWLATTDMINHVETRNQEHLAPLEKRLAAIFQTPIGSENNPFGAATFAHAFQSAIKKLDLQPAALQLCYSAFKQLLTQQTGTLYEKMNDLLMGRGVLPHLDLSHPPPVARAQRAEREDTAPASPPATAAAEADHSQPAPQAPSLYQIADQLRALQAAVRRQGGQPDMTAAPAPAVSPQMGQAAPPSGSAEGMGSLPQYGTEEILDALRALPQGSFLQSASGEHDYVSPIQALLAERHGNAGVIAPRERNIMSVTGDIFQSLLQDMLIASNVKSWMQRLEIPLLRLALQDESLFLDKNHVARQVVNKIARLELYDRDGGTGSHSAIHRKIDQLLEQIATQPEVDSAAFAHALKELEHLVRIQDEAYNANLEDLVKGCEQEQQRVAAAAGPGSQGTLQYLRLSEDNCARQVDDESQYREWLRKVRRLRVGEWLLFSNDDGETQRLRLAWVGKHRDRYVFVNLRGLRELTLSAEGLAQRLSDGSATVLENADDPALDRAQYNMLQNLHRQLMHETTHDQLTGLLNRREFERLTREALQGDAQGERGHILCYMDLDQFDVINSRCGYEAGDQLLREVTALLREAVDEDTPLARLGGDDFALLLDDCTVEEATARAQALQARVAAHRFVYEDRHYPASLSIGLVPLFTGIASITELLQAGEAGCRLAQEKGGGHIHVYHHDDEALARKQELLHWLSRVDEALESEALELRCQPIVPITPEGYEKPHHSEILLAMHDDQGRPISPEGFILAAEHYNRMPVIDRWVIRNVFRWMRDHAALLDETGGFAINLSGRSLNDETFKDFILAEIRDSGVPVERLCFEVTETAGIDNLSSAADFILAVKESGCSFSLDDFGSGMSSYGYLKNLPVDYLKIDGAFVKEIDKNPEDYAVVKSITEIGHFMGKKIIAEYVESEAILDLLREIGVDYAQGYAVGKPRLLRDVAGA